MGCGGSTNNEQRKRKESIGSIFKRPPKVSIRTGNAVKVLDNKPRIILVFGGPGTKKGKILDNLANVFNFKLLNVEQIILQELAQKLEKPDPNNITPAIQQMLKSTPEILRLDWVLRMIGKRLENADKEQIYVIDFMPNLKFLLNITTFVKECNHEFRVFEEKYPVSFTINLVMPKDKVMKKVEVECAKHPNTSKDQSKGQSDEADSSRTQKRVALYENSVKHVLDYYTKTEKLVTIDVSCSVMDAIWNKIYDYFVDLGFQARKSAETIVVFGFDETELKEFEEMYSLTVVSLRELAYDSDAPVEHMLDSLCRYIDQQEASCKVFAVDTTGTTFTKQWQGKVEKRRILFHDGSDRDINEYSYVSLTTKSRTINLQAVSSLQNEICLFNSNIPQEFCIRVAALMRTSRDKERMPFLCHMATMEAIVTRGIRACIALQAIITASTAPMRFTDILLIYDLILVVIEVLTNAIGRILLTKFASNLPVNIVYRALTRSTNQAQNDIFPVT